MPASRGRSDSGTSLVELIVYMMLSVLVLSIVVGIWTSGLSGVRLVRGLTDATNSGQLAAEAIQLGVRNSSGFDVSTPSGQDQILLMRVASGGTQISWSCAAWYYSDAEKTIRTRTSTGRIAPPTAAELATWLVIATGIVPADGARVFSRNGAQLDLDFTVSAGEPTPVIIKSSAFSRTTTMEMAPCA